MHHPTDRIIHTTAFVTPVVEHWLEIIKEGITICSDKLTHCSDSCNPLPSRQPSSFPASSARPQPVGGPSASLSVPRPQSATVRSVYGSLYTSALFGILVLRRGLLYPRPRYQDVGALSGGVPLAVGYPSVEGRTLEWERLGAVLGNLQLSRSSPFAYADAACRSHELLVMAAGRVGRTNPKMTYLKSRWI